MNTDTQSQNPDGFTDPRSRAEFQPQHYPRVNGQEAPPPSATERNDRIKLEFLAAYYELNCACARLLAVRQEADSPARPGPVTQSLDPVAQASAPASSRTVPVRESESRDSRPEESGSGTLPELAAGTAALPRPATLSLAPPARREAEKKSLQNVERLLIVRDGLEDQYAPLGVIAEPVVKDGYTVNVILSFGNVDAAGRLRSELYTLTACVPVPLPEGFKFEDLDLKIEGPGVYPP